MCHHDIDIITYQTPYIVYRNLDYIKDLLKVHRCLTIFILDIYNFYVLMNKEIWCVWRQNSLLNNHILSNDEFLDEETFFWKLDRW